MTPSYRRVLAVFLLVGLVASASFASSSFTREASAAKKIRYVDLDRVPKPKISGKQIVAGLEELVEKFPLRHNGLPNNAAIAGFLAKESKRYGFKTKIRKFDGPATAPEPLRVVEAVKRGTKKPNEWIAFIAHYDVVAPDGAGLTIQGAYDDGSGTNIMRYFARAFSKIKTKRSIALLWFDAEEKGLLASQAYAEYLKKKGQKVHAALGFDMVGIGYPARYCICIYHGPNEDAATAVPVSEYVNFDYLGFPKGDGAPGAQYKWPIGADGHICICGQNIRNSDESNFAEQGWFSMRWTGMRTAMDYPGYHQPWDTVPFMELVAGGRKNLEKGTENTFKSAYYTTFVLDNLPYLSN